MNEAGPVSAARGKRGQGGVTPVFRTVDLGHIPQAVEPLFVLSGGLVTQRRVHACPIVEGLDVVEHRHTEKGSGSFTEKGSGSFTGLARRCCRRGHCAR